LPQEVAGLIWPGPVGDDAYQLALQQPMPPEQFKMLLGATNSGMVPKEQLPRAVQQLIAVDSVEQARQQAEVTGEPVEQALGRIAQQRAGGEFDENDITSAFENKVTEDATQSVQQRFGAADPQAIEQEKERLKKDPGLLDKLFGWWEKAPIDEKIAAIVGIAGGVIALVNTLMGGSGTTSLITGALGLGGLAYALGGGKWLKKQFGWGGEEAAPDVTPAGQQKATAETANAQPGAPPATAGAPPVASVGPPQGNIVQNILADNKVEPQEIYNNMDQLRGMEDAQLMPLIEAAPESVKQQLAMANTPVGRMFASGALEDINNKLPPGKSLLTMDDLDRMIELYNMTQG